MRSLIVTLSVCLILAALTGPTSGVAAQDAPANKPAKLPRHDQYAALL